MKAQITNERMSTARSRDLRAETGVRTATIAVGASKPAAAGIPTSFFGQERATP